MKTSKELKEERGDLETQMNAIIASALKENRNITDNEEKRFDQLDLQKDALNKQIKTAEKMERFKRESMPNSGTVIGGGEDKELGKISKRYSIAELVQHRLSSNGGLVGVYAEMDTEAIKEARTAGVKLAGHGLPSKLVHFVGSKRAEQRALEVAVAANGGNMVETTKRDFIPVLRPKLKTIEMGAEVLTGLQGNVDIQTQDAAASAAWAGEKTTATESQMSIGKFTMSPKRLAAWTQQTRQFFLQSYLAIEPLVRGDLEAAIQIALDAALINGSGASNQPTGLLNWTGIGSVAMGTNGLAPTREALVDLESAIATENADAAMLKFLSTPGIRGKLRKTKTDAGSGIFIWGEQSNSLLGYEAHVSTQVPNNLVKGTSSDANAIIFGDWSKLRAGNWGGIDLVVNPYTHLKEAMVEVVVNSYWDVAVMQPKAFAAIKDALTA
jgi:HK97 family phage major capsid protein